MTRLEKYYALIPLALLCVSYVFIACGKPVHDFANYYFGGQFLGEGRFGPNIYFPYWFNRQIAADGHAPLFAGFAPNTPFLALLFYPLSLLPLSVAKIVFNALSVALFAFSVKRLAGFYKIASVYVLLIPVLFLVPIRNEILFGQVYLLLFFLLAESWLAYEKQHRLKSAIFLAFAILLKVFPALLLLFFVFKKDFRTLACSIGVCLVLLTMTLPFCDLATWQFYFCEVLKKASDGEIASAYVANYQSAFMFFKRLLAFDAVENPGGLLSDPSVFNAIVFAFKIAVIAIGWQVAKNAKPALFVFSYWILAAILISPYGSTYTFILLLFPYFSIVKSELSAAKKLLLFGLIFLISNLPLSVFIEMPFPVSYLRFFTLIAFFIVMISTVWRSLRWKIVSALSAIGLAFGLTFGDSGAAGDYFLPNSPLLINDFKIGNQKLTYFYWNADGENRETMPLEISSIDPADLIANQIYYRGKLLVYDNSHKRKPMIINKKTLIYLTDADRGIGFYTLRKIDLR